MSEQNTTIVYGRHVVLEAVTYRPDCVCECFIATGSKDIELMQAIERAGVSCTPFDPRMRPLPGRIDPHAVHQGALACVAVDALMQPYTSFMQELDVTADTALLIMGEVQDPHNVGAAIRSAAAFGVTAVLLPPHNQAPITGAVAKVSAGALFRIPMVHIANVNTTIRDLQNRGFWVYGLDGRGDTSLNEELFTKPTAFVLGNEATGLREKTREASDFVLRIPIHSRSESLNASASTAVVLHAWSTQHPKALDR